MKLHQQHQTTFLIIYSNVRLKRHTGLNLSHICWIYFTCESGKKAHRTHLGRGLRKNFDGDSVKLLNFTFKADRSGLELPVVLVGTSSWRSSGASPPCSEPQSAAMFNSCQSKNIFFPTRKCSSFFRLLSHNNLAGVPTSASTICSHVFV